MTQHLRWSLVAAIGLSVALAACSTSRFGGEGESHGPVTANGVEQFPVPQDGRSLLAQRLVQLVPGRITDARISNAWRTAAAAQVKPNDYAACVSASGGRGTQVFLIVKSGRGTGDVISGTNALQRCADTNRVTQWVTLPEADQR
jgi:hypothetical protein